MARSFRLTPPPLDAMLERPRLLHQLRRRFDLAATTVVAGAGFGKSVLLAQAMRDNVVAPRGTDLWLSCDAGDAVPTNLLSGLAASAELDPRRAIDASAYLAAIAERWPTGVCLILDDVHLVPEGSAGSVLLLDLVSDAPPGVSFLLASRTPVSGLARLRAQGRLLALGEDDLAYHRDETAQLGGDRASHLGGWPALVSLASTFGDEAAREFVVEELISTIDPDTRRALATLALVGGADQEVAEIAVGGPIDLLALSILPLVTTDGTHVVPHALWSDLLVDELSRGEAQEILGRVGRALLERGDEVRAGAVFLTAADVDGLRLAVRAACSQGYATTPRDVLATWWEALGPSDRSSCEAVLLDALVRRSVEPFSDETRAALEKAVVAAREAGDVRLEIAALWEFGFVARARGELEELLAEIPRVLALEAGGESLARPLATIARVVVSDALGDQAGAKEHLEGLDRSAVAEGWVAPVEFLRMVFAFSDGDLPAVETAAGAYLDGLPDDFPGRAFVGPWVDWLRGVAPDWETLPVPGTFPGSTAADRLWSGSCIGLMLAYANRSVEAATAVEVAVAAAETARLPQLQATVAGARAALEVSLGREDAARAVLEVEVGAELGAIDAKERGLRHALAVGYVLVPELRQHWDRTELGALHDHGRALARAVLAVREDLAPSGLDEPFVLDHLATALPLSWAVEVACGCAADEPVRAREMVERLVGMHGEGTRAALRSPAASGPSLVARGATALLASVPVGSVAVEVRVLGPAELVVGGRVVAGADWRRGRVRALLCLLAERRRVRREEAMDLLWPDLDMEAARHNLRVTLGYLQGLVEPGRRSGEAPFYLRQDGDWLALLDEPHVVVDGEQFDRAIARGDRARADGQLALARAAYDQAFDLWRGGYLLDAVNEEWAQSPRARVASRATTARLASASIRLALDDASGAIDEAYAALEIDPWSESAHRLVIAGHLGRSDRPAALRAMQRCRSMLDELGVPASAETRQLERRLGESDVEPPDDGERRSWTAEP